MYSTLRSVQYVVAMLKEKGIDKCVISPGNSHNAIVRSIEEDDYFQTYNIVDERSAAYFAIGILQEIKKPVAIICTAGTAVSNYLPGVTEAYYRNLPLVVITADKNEYYLDQNEDQMIEQKFIFKDVTKSSKTLPIVKDKNDAWYCNRILNEAFLEMDHHGTGPIHINVPIDEGKLAMGQYFNEKVLPKINVIDRLDSKSKEEIWRTKFESLGRKKILIIYGQSDNHSEKVKFLIEGINKKYNCVIAVDKLSNLTGNDVLEISRAALYNKEINNSNLIPDLIISLEGNSVLDYKFKLKSNNSNFDHWTVNKEGKIVDPFKKLTTIFECDTEEFLENMNNYGEEINDNSYFNTWKNENTKFVFPEIEYSNLYTIGKVMNQIPKDSMLHLANSSTIRLSQFFDLDQTIQVYCNRGVNGIDGCLSTFIGQASVTDKLSFLIIGDLTFFYDMNALWNRYVGKNVRILLNNNEGASLFHFNQGLTNYPKLNHNVAAEHFTVAKGWVEDQGFKYLSANNKDEFNNVLDEFLNSDSEHPIMLEVFTKKENDAKIQKDFYDLNKAPMERKAAIKSNIKKAVKSVISQNTIDKIRSKY